MKKRQKEAHMMAAYVYAGLSYCKRKQVGCVIIKQDRSISIGYNGTPPGEDNCCEDDNQQTKPNVIHAELNALKKLTNINETCEGATLFVTASPCEDCALEIIERGIKHVVYGELYKNDAGIQILTQQGVLVEQIK